MRRLFLCVVVSLLWGAGAVGGERYARAQSVMSAPDAPPAPQVQQIGPHNAMTIRAVGRPGHWNGFDVLADEQIIAPVRFTSHALIFSPQAIAATTGRTSTLTFDGLQTAPDCGLVLEHSRVVVTLTEGQYPTVAFDLHLTHFDVRLWQQAVGLQPFHFLTLAMPDAEMWHQGGGLYPTPRADLFPLLLAPLDPAHPFNACADNREWSRTPSLAAHALPVIGLWSPARRLYAAWDFQEARLGAGGQQSRQNGRDAQDKAKNTGQDAAEDTTENENMAWERDIATGFCNRLIVSFDPFLLQTIETAPPSHATPDYDVPQGRNGQPPPRRDPRTRKLLNPAEQASREYDTRGVSKFVALVYPPQSGSIGLQPAYPAHAARLAAHTTLLFHTSLSATDDPNRLCWERWWNTPAIQTRLSRVPRVNDLGWIPDALHLRALPSPFKARLLTSTPCPDLLPGTLRLSPSLAHDESSPTAPAHTGDTTLRTQMQADARLLMTYARRFNVDKEPCVYWPQPLAGEWTPARGGEAATTLHNSDGWAAAQRLLTMQGTGNGPQETGENKTPVERQGRGRQGQESKAQESKARARQREVIDGVFNWAKHVGWMRGGRTDAPVLPTVRDGAGAIAFLLDYYFAFKDERSDGERRTRALLALDLARSFAYRYLPMRAGGRGQDEQTPGFSAESGIESGSAAETTDADIAANLDTLAQVAAHTGDPILLWALQDSVWKESQRYTARRQEHYSRSQAGQSEAAAAPAEGAANAQAIPFMPPIFTPSAVSYSLLDPIGDSNARVVCGERAAMCFNRGERDIVVTDYRCERAGEFAFTVRRLGARGLRPVRGEAIRLTVTFCNADLSHKSAAVRHGNLTQRLLTPQEITREPGASWSLVVGDLRDGDTLVVGTPDLNAAQILPSTPPLAE